MFGLENRGKTLIFMSRHFDQTMTILIRINQIIYFKQKIGRFIQFGIFLSTFPTSVFPINFVQGGVQRAYG